MPLPFRRVYLDTARDNVIVEQKQDVSGILALNRAMAQHYTPGSKLWNKEQFVHVASIPLILIDIWKKAGIDFYDPNDFPIIIRLLNSNDYSKLRIAGGKI